MNATVRMTAMRRFADGQPWAESNSLWRHHPAFDEVLAACSHVDEPEFSGLRIARYYENEPEQKGSRCP